MSNSIDWSTIVGKGTIEDGGYIGSLLTLSRAHLDDARDKGQLSDSQVGEVYSNLIPSAIQAGISFEFDKRTKGYEGDIAEIKVETANVEKLIMDEKYVTIQEENGKISYKYIYKYSYQDYSKIEHFLNPNKVDPETGKVIQGYVDANGKDTEYIKVNEVFDQYENGDGTWKIVNTIGVNSTYSIIEQYYRAILPDGSILDTNVSAFRNNQFAGKECYIFINAIGDTIIVKVGSILVCDSGNINQDMEDLKTINGVPRIASDWDDLYANGNSILTNLYKRTIMPNVNNIYNHANISRSRLGWDGSGTPPEYGMLNSAEQLSYKVNIDYSNIFSKTISGETGLGEDSMVQLEKKKLLTDIQLSIDKLKLSKIPSTLR